MTYPDAIRDYYSGCLLGVLTVAAEPARQQGIPLVEHTGVSADISSMSPD
jgi:hypothetical protein